MDEYKRAYKHMSVHISKCGTSVMCVKGRVLCTLCARASKCTPRAILKAMKEAQKEGKGAVTLDGRLIDIASVRQAQVMVKKAREVARAD